MLLVRAHDSEELRLRTEVEEESDLESGASEVAQKLPARIRMKMFGGLHFDDDLVVNDHVEALDAEFLSFVIDCHGHFASDTMPAGAQLALQGHHVQVFQ